MNTTESIVVSGFLFRVLQKTFIEPLKKVLNEFVMLSMSRRFTGFRI